MLAIYHLLLKTLVALMKPLVVVYVVYIMLPFLPMEVRLAKFLLKLKKMILICILYITELVMIQTNILRQLMVTILLVTGTLQLN